MANWFTYLSNAIYREYDRRIKRASQVTEYGAHHENHSATHADEAEDVVIANVPRGAAIADAEEDGVVIANVPRGAVVAPPASNDGAQSAENRE